MNLKLSDDGTFVLDHNINGPSSIIFTVIFSSSILSNLYPEAGKYLLGRPIMDKPL
ncbi:hypothetical protein [Lutibacter citreus]|uniref:hypothetical protein n=1 Tax=Lutibacter citreus TaxID=2138210 RepID=UPI0013007E9B|nr:hypothetical protein [Lutibacter citreus]